MQNCDRKHDFNKYKIKIFVFYFILVFIVSFFFRFNLLSNFFVLDDFILIVNNTFITGINNLLEVLNPKNLFSVLPIRCGARPLTVASLIVDYSVSALNPFWYHFINLFLHSVNSVLLFLFCYNLKKRNLFFALTSSLFYSFHPIQTEVISVISFRADLLFSFFSLAALNLVGLFTIQDKKINRKFIYLLVFFFMCCAFFSKENAIVLPVIIFVFIYLFCNNNKNLLKVSFLSFIFILFLFFFFWIERFPIPLYFTIYPNLPLNVMPLSTVSNYINTIFSALFCNILHVLYPVRLSVDYTLFFSGYVTGFMILFVLSIISFIAYTKDKYIKFALITLIFMYLPVSNVVPLVNSVADRYLYFPMIAVSVLFGLLILKLQRVINKNLLICFLSSLFMINIFISYQRGRIYANQYYLYSDAIIRAPGNIRVLYNMSVAYFENKEYEKAINTLNTLMAVNPVYMRDKVWLITGMSYDKLNNKEKALQYYHKAFLLNPKNEEISGKFISCFVSSRQAFQYLLKHTKKINSAVVSVFQQYQNTVSSHQ